MRSNRGPEILDWLSVCAFGRLRTGFGRIVEMAATARVHGGDEWDARRVGDVGVDARNGGAPGFQRLVQGLQRATLEFRQFVQEQHAEMGQRHFAGSGPGPPPISDGVDAV